jgi:hypothetical protein
MSHSVCQEISCFYEIQRFSYCVHKNCDSLHLEYPSTGKSQLSAGRLTSSLSPRPTKYNVLQRIWALAYEPSLVCCYSVTAAC